MSSSVCHAISPASAITAIAPIQSQTSALTSATPR